MTEAEYRQLVSQVLGRDRDPRSLYRAIDAFVKVGGCECLPPQLREAILVARALMERLWKE